VNNNEVGKMMIHLVIYQFEITLTSSFHAYLVHFFVLKMSLFSDNIVQHFTLFVIVKNLTILLL